MENSDSARSQMVESDLSVILFVKVIEMEPKFSFSRLSEQPRFSSLLRWSLILKLFCSKIDSRSVLNF